MSGRGEWRGSVGRVGGDGRHVRVGAGLERSVAAGIAEAKVELDRVDAFAAHAWPVAGGHVDACRPRELHGPRTNVLALLLLHETVAAEVAAVLAELGWRSAQAGHFECKEHSRYTADSVRAVEQGRLQGVAAERCVGTVFFGVRLATGNGAVSERLERASSVGTHWAVRLRNQCGPAGRKSHYALTRSSLVVRFLPRGVLVVRFFPNLTTRWRVVRS